MSSLMAHWILIGVIYGAANRFFISPYLHKLAKNLNISDQSKAILIRIENAEPSITGELIVAAVTAIMWPVFAVCDAMLIIYYPGAKK